MRGEGIAGGGVGWVSLASTTTQKAMKMGKNMGRRAKETKRREANRETNRERRRTKRSRRAKRTWRRAKRIGNKEYWENLEEKEKVEVEGRSDAIILARCKTTFILFPLVFSPRLSF